MYQHTGMNFQWYTEEDDNDFCIERVYIESVEDEFGESMHDVSKIIMDGEDYYKEECALNIVVYDKVLNQVVDAVGVMMEEGTPIVR